MHARTGRGAAALACGRAPRMREGEGVQIPFVKLHAAGNAYLAIDGRDAPIDGAVLATAMCVHRLAIGSDGLLVAERSDVADVRMRVWNSDGSEAEMSGNGIRLFAKFVLDRGLVPPRPDGLRVETRGGVRTVWPRMGPAGMIAARVAMGKPTFLPREIPLEPSRAAAFQPPSTVTLELGERRLELLCLAIGNPHAVALLDEPIDAFPLASIGPRVMTHPAFPNRINFEIVNVVAPDRIRARIFERGEGETPASGTGSTASVIAARVLRGAASHVVVELPGGELAVEWDGAGEAFLEGPTVEVFSGRWAPPADALRAAPS
jgi:diaminopimelate epimerase